MILKRSLCLMLSIAMVLSLLGVCHAGQPADTVFSPGGSSAAPNSPSRKAASQTAAAVLSAERDAELHADLQARIDEILTTETEIVHSDTFIPGKTYTGTAYYVSADGSDDNDGLTPETAWQSVDKLLRELDQREGSVLKPGDAVFLRRGDVFRLYDWSLELSAENITLSAYGEGAKPILTASSENGAGAEKWTLVYEEDGGRKIWQYYRDMRDVSRIVLNDGEAIATRVYEYYNENGYISCEATGWWMHEAEGVTLLDALLPLEESMTEDLSIISRPVRFDYKYGCADPGSLYLRCDAGNPGALYDSIEFTEYQPMSLIWLEAGGAVFDNISFRCNGNSYIKSANYNDGRCWKEIQNTVVQNCEFAYGGGSVTSYHEREDGAVIVETQGDGIYTVVRNTTIQNNYFHDAAASDVTYEAELSDDAAISDSYYHYLNNVSVNTIGIRLDSTSVALQYLSSVKVCGNHVWNVGHSDTGKISYSEGALVMMPNHYGECIITDNVFYGTENGHPMNALLDILLYNFDYFAEYTRPQFGRNIYIQYAGRNFGDFIMQGEAWGMDDPELLTKAAEYLGDSTSEFYIIE